MDMAPSVIRSDTGRWTLDGRRERERDAEVDLV